MSMFVLLTRNRLRLLGLCAGALAATEPALAQQTVTGTVTDGELGEPLIGATVLVVGESTGTVTEYDGTYAIEVVAPAELRFSYVGYAPQTLAVNPTTRTLDVTLAEGELLDEVVVVGYGSQRKGDLTGSIQAIDERQFNNGAIVEPTNLIAGKVAGVQVTTGSGAPGAGPEVRIRGGTSINASNTPLYVIDGVPLDPGDAAGRGPLSFVNPADIATMTILKDASATAIYGSRGANGVVIITTKTGTASQAPRLTYDGSATVSTLPAAAAPDVLDAAAFRGLVDTLVGESRREQLGEAATDFYDEVTRAATGQQHSLAVSGGTASTTYRLSLGYLDLEGVLRGSSTRRSSASFNLRQELLDERLAIAASFKGSVTDDLFDPGVVQAAARFDPTQPVFAPDGDETFAGFFEYGTALAPRNPVSSVAQRSDESRILRGLGNVELSYDFRDLVEGLEGRLIGGFDILASQRDRYQPTTFATEAVSGFDGEARVETGQRTNRLLEGYLVFTRALSERHRLRLTGGYSYQDFAGANPGYRAFNFENDLFGTNTTVAATEFEAFNNTFENRLISFFGRANYNLDERVLVTATLRRDGSTRFGPGNQWGTFPSAAVAWRVLQEPWAGGLAEAFSDLKVRVGWGVTGNQDFDNFLYLPRYQLSDVRTRYPFGDRFVTTARPNGYDDGLQWEETASTNVGLDLGLLNGRLTTTLEYYHKRTDELLFTVNVPAGTNLTDRVLTNIGAVENEGVELTVGAVVLDTDTWRFDLSANASYNRNEVLEIDGDASARITRGGIEGGVGNTVQLIQVGEAVDAFYLYEQLYEPDGSPRRDGVDYNDDGQADLADLYADQNGDGVVNDEDLRIIGQPAPRMLFGLTGNVGYGPLDLAFTLRGAAGNDVYDNNASSLGFLDVVTLGPNFLGNVHASALTTGFQRAQFFSDYYLESGGFLRLDNVTLGYDVTDAAQAPLGLRVYATAQNLFVLSDYSGGDPELGTGGIDNAPYPRPRTYVLGARLSF